MKKAPSRINPWEWALVAVTAVWGWTFVTVHDAIVVFPVSAFLSYRFSAAAVILGAALLPVLRRLTRKELLGGIGAGCALFAGYALQTAGLGSTTPSNAAFITGLAVVFTPLFAFLLFRIRPHAKQIVGACLAAVGLGLLTMQGLAVHRGDVLVLGCAMAFAFHILILSRVSPGAHPGRLTFVQLATVGLLASIWAAGADEMLPPRGTHVWLALLVTAVIASSLAFFVQTKAQATTPPNRVALIFTLEPVFGGLFGYWLAGDRLTRTNLFGAALILVAILVTEMRSSRQAHDV